MNEEILIPIVLFATAFGVLYVFFTTRNKERLALIEKGADANLLKIKRDDLSALKIGMFLTGVALGLILGNVIAETTRLKEEIVYFSMTLLGGGLSLILFYFLEKRIIKNKKDGI